MKQLSVALAVFNEERFLADCLRSVQSIADEIVVVDGGSTDATCRIAESFNVKLYQTDNPALFHINKQKALDLCHGSWVLQLDADEVVTPALAKEVASIIADQDSKDGYFVPRRNIFWGHAMKKTGVYPDYVIRLFRRKSGHFPCKSVHEQIEIAGATGYLTEPLLHYSYTTMGDYWRKANAYTSLTARELSEQKLPLTLETWWRYCCWYPVKTFFSLFIRNQGFVDGIAGWLFSCFSALHHPIAYWKYWQRKRRNNQ